VRYLKYATGPVHVRGILTQYPILDGLTRFKWHPAFTGSELKNDWISVFFCLMVPLDIRI